MDGGKGGVAGWSRISALGEDSSTTGGTATGGNGGTGSNGGVGGNGADGNVYAGNPTQPGPSTPSANNSSATGGSGGSGNGKGVTGGNGQEASVVGLGDDHADGQIATGNNGADKP